MRGSSFWLGKLDEVGQFHLSVRQLETQTNFSFNLRSNARSGSQRYGLLRQQAGLLSSRHPRRAPYVLWNWHPSRCGLSEGSGDIRIEVVARQHGYALRKESAGQAATISASTATPPWFSPYTTSGLISISVSSGRAKMTPPISATVLARAAQSRDGNPRAPRNSA